MNPNNKKVHLYKGRNGDLRLSHCGKWLPIRVHSFTVNPENATCRVCIRSMGIR